jgi:DnaJ-class molecular chaperone
MTEKLTPVTGTLRIKRPCLTCAGSGQATTFKMHNLEVFTQECCRCKGTGSETVPMPRGWEILRVEMGR